MSTCDGVPVQTVSFKEAFRFWMKVAVLSFGGPAGQIAVMHRHLVEERRWISESRFLHALNYCMLLPGPEAQQLAIYFGWLLHGTRGGLVAGILFVLPGALAIRALSMLYAVYQALRLVRGLLRPQAGGPGGGGGGPDPHRPAHAQNPPWSPWPRSLRGHLLLRPPFPLIILAAAFVGFAGGRRWPRRFYRQHSTASKVFDPCAEPVIS